MLLKNYDKNIRPPPSDRNAKEGPVLVKVNMLIRMLSKIDVVNMEYNMQITLREQWPDHRLAYEKFNNISYKPKFLTVPYAAKHIWMPDSFFPTEKNAHRHLIDTENMFIRIYPDGTVLYSVRLSLTCSCPMYLALYPLDVQHCDFDLISYAFTTKDIVYEWDTSGDPVQKKAGVGTDLPNFHLANIDTGIECTSHTNTGTYGCLRMRLKLTRLLQYFVLQLYVPTGMIVIVSWMSFWIDSSSTAGRVALAVTTLLTSFTMQTSINAKLPPVNYVKVIDVWLGTCQTFVFFALIEYAVVCYKETNIQNEKAAEMKLRKKQQRPKELGAFESGDPRLPCTCGAMDTSQSIFASLGAFSPVLSTMVPLSAGILTGSMAENMVASDCCGRMRPAFAYRTPMNLSSRSFWQMLKNKFKKPDYLPARIDYYARVYVLLFFAVFNVLYWTVCLYMAANWEHPTK
ncbi:unnamed protein product [Bursaphelenchus xylophilus]|uniref:(pine wood nematode) hypothetical protein n=1 Tax=Bursaphelenchus xylophilus TaxID=6326 RepID=A0A1I7S5X4_BURXY|nr:unnamed protein product [Bursaphelenchus xylophilus]CAG9082574.1 unnamed protein product [Bursaphelenchus xylophilus]